MRATQPEMLRSGLIKRQDAAKPSRTEGTPVPLGTNELKVGANLFSPHNSYHFGAVVELDRWHEFPDGSVKPGALLRATNGFETWTPREKLMKVLVVQ